MLKHLLIIEPALSGHHAEYLSWIIEGSVGSRFFVTLATDQDWINNSTIVDVYDKYTGSIEVVAMHGLNHSQKKSSVHLLSMLRKQQETLASYKSTYLHVHGKNKVDMVLIPYLDNCIYAIGLFGSPFGSTPWSGISMRSNFHHYALGISANHSFAERAKQWVYFRLLKNRFLQNLYTIDETLPKFVESKSSYAKKLKYLADPARPPKIMEKLQARKLLDLPADKLVILVYGALSIRKGVGVFLEAIKIAEFHQDILVLLAGLQDNEFKKELSEQRGSLPSDVQICEYDRYIEACEEGVFFSSADIVWLGYKDHASMSGVLVLAGQYGLPVLSTDKGLMGYLVKKHDCGLSFNVGEIGAVSTGIHKLCTDLKLRRKLGKNGENAYKEHTFESAKKSIFC